MGKEGIIAEHPTLKVKYVDPEMAKLALELKEKVEEARRIYDENHHVEEQNKEDEEKSESVSG